MFHQYFLHVFKGRLHGRQDHVFFGALTAKEGNNHLSSDTQQLSTALVTTIVNGSCVGLKWNGFAFVLDMGNCKRSCKEKNTEPSECSVANCSVRGLLEWLGKPTA